MSIVFDLTTYEGINNSIVFDVDSQDSKTLHTGELMNAAPMVSEPIGQNSKTLHVVGGLIGAVISPSILGVGCITIGGLLGYFSSQKGKVSSDKQLEAARRLIAEGKRNNIKRLKLIVDRETGISLSSDIQGVSLNTKIGNYGQMTIEVEYK